MQPDRPGVLVLDSMLGWTGRHSVSQGELVADLLRERGHRVETASPRTNRFARLIDLALAPIRHRRHVQVVTLAVFSGPAFWLADIPSRITRLLGIPTVLVLHGGNLPVLAAAKPARVGRLLRRATAVVSPSTYNAEALGPLADRPIRVVPNVVVADLPAAEDLDTERPGPPKILWMRSLEELYAPEVAIDAFRLLLEVRPDATLTMAGPDTGGIADELHQLVDELGLADAITFTGFLGPDDKLAAFGAHHLYLNTTRIDNTPVTPLEAAGHGLPVVTTDPGGIRHLFEHDRTAVIVAVDDAAALCDAMLAVLDDHPRRTRLVGAARAMVEAMRPDAVGQHWSELLTEIASRD